MWFWFPVFLLYFAQTPFLILPIELIHWPTVRVRYFDNRVAFPVKRIH